MVIHYSVNWPSITTLCSPCASFMYYTSAVAFHYIAKDCK